MDNKKNAKKNDRKFNCDSCDYNTSNRYDFNRHLLTAKHRLDKKPIGSYTCLCGKTYKFQSGLCKHRHKCVLLNSDNNLEFKKGDLVDLEKSSNNNFP